MELTKPENRTRASVSIRNSSVYTEYSFMNHKKEELFNTIGHQWKEIYDLLVESHELVSV